MTINTRNKAFTLLEMMVSITALAGIITVGFVGFTEVNSSVKARKLEQDVAVVNNAVRMYVAHGGQLGPISAPQAIVDKLKTVPTTDNAKQIAGLRGSMVDPRLEVIVQTLEQAESDQPRALWNTAEKRFQVVRQGEPGVLGFRMNKALVLTNPLFDDNRNVTLKLAKNSSWVWDYIDTDNATPASFGPVRTGSTATVPFGVPNTPPGPLALNPPSFSMDGGTYPLADYDSFTVTLSDPNPSGSSQMFFTEDGASWSPYTGQIFTVLPDDQIQAIAVSLDPDSWTDSPMAGNTYTANPVKMEISVNVPRNPISYAEAGGSMITGDPGTAVTPIGPIAVSLSNSADVPNRYQNSETFNVVWSYDGSDPLFGAAGSGGTFADGFPGVNVDYSLTQWGSDDSLTVKIIAQSLETGILAHSDVSSTDVGINKITLRDLQSSLDGYEVFTADQKISFIPTSSHGDLPQGWRVYYTTDGADPGVGEDGEPLRGNLYTGEFDVFSGSSSDSEIKARLYGPSGYAHWFTPSDLFSKEFSRWSAPEWDGYIGGDFSVATYSSFNNVKQHQDSGVLDTSFNPGSGLNDQGRCVALQSDGKAIVGGDFTSVNGIARKGIVRLNTDGSVDTSFDPGAGTDDDVLAVAIQPDGKILVGGKFRKFNNQWRKGLVRLNSDGSIDWSFNVGQAVHSDDDGWVHGIAMQSDGKVIIGGCFSRYNYNSAKSLARVNANGSHDSSFDTTPGVSGLLHAVQVQPDGKVLIAGGFSKYDNASQKNIARVLSNGRIDPSFDSGRGPNKDVYTISQFSDGKLFIGGNFSDVDKVKRQGVARLNTDGSVDSGFDLGSGHGIPSWIVYASAITSDGKVVTGGNLRSYSPHSGGRAAFVRLQSNGNLDAAYSPEDLPQHSYVYGIAVRSGGEALITGKFPEDMDSSAENLARIDTETGQIDTSFDVGVGADGVVNAVTKLSDGDVLVGGAFAKVKGSNRSRLAKLGADGTVRSFNVNITGGNVYAIDEQSDGKILIGGDFDSVAGNGNYEGLARLNADGSLDTSFVLEGSSYFYTPYPWYPWYGWWVSSYGFDGAVREINALENGTVIVGGSFSNYGASSQRAIALLNSDGSNNGLLSSANGNIPFSGTVYKSLLLPNGKMLYTGSFDSEVNCLNADGSVDSSFSPASINGAVRDLALLPDGRIAISGDFTYVNGNSRNRIAVLSASGALETAFTPGSGSNDRINEIRANDAGQLALLGEVTSFAGQVRKGTVRVNANGSVDAAFGNSTLNITTINSTD